MVIYEVNLTINNEIFQAYHHWLVKHIEVMLTFKGFKQAEIANEKTESEGSDTTTKMTVRYTIDNEEDLDDYLKNYAPKMRKDGIDKFGDKFNAFRRIFKNPNVLKAKSKKEPESNPIDVAIKPSLIGLNH